MTPGDRVWVTRAEPGAEATAGRLRALGFTPVVAPLLKVRPIAGGSIDLDGVAALAFTSANGVAAFAGRSPERRLPVFAVGAATAGAARAAGFADVTAGEGDAAALTPIIASRGPFTGVVLHLAPTEPAGDLVAALSISSIAARRLAIYETVALALDADILARLPALGAVLLHSPKAARVLADGLFGAAAAAARHLEAFCLSANVAASLAHLHLAAVHVAAATNDAALLEALVASTAAHPGSDDGQTPG